MKFLYTLGIRCYGLAILIASLFNEKARKWRHGRRDIFVKLEEALSNVKEPVIWVHCSSLGEFEQGRPVMEAFRQKFPAYKILLTFFSPSGYEVRKNYPGADYIFYLPLDTYSNAKRFVEIIEPKISVFVKYEFWYNYLNKLHSSNIPVYLISAKFRPEQYFFKGYASWFRQQLKEYKKIFVQDPDSERLLKDAGIENVIVAGDTRFDRVVAIARQTKSNPTVKAFKGSGKLWVCGSTWPEDEKLIAEAYKTIIAPGEKIKLLIVPHEIGAAHIDSILNNFPGAVRYSTVKESEVCNINVMIVDKIGLLSSLYSYGDFAYIGGGFGKGIHNLPEAAVFGIPVLFGTNYHKFNEAGELIKSGGGFSVANAGELLKQVSLFIKDEAYRKSCGDLARNYIFSTKGATEKIISELEKVAKT